MMHLRKNGFTLLELLLIIAIVSTIFVFSAPYTIRFYNSQVVSEVQNNITNALSQARHNALLQKNDSSWGVKIDEVNNIYVLFQGQSYEERVSEFDEIYSLRSDISFDAEMSEIVFGKFNGIPNSSGNITIIFNDLSRVINIDEKGVLSKI